MNTVAGGSSEGERGFVVAEILLAIGLFVGLGFAVLAVFVMFGRVLHAQGTVTGTIATLDQEADRIRSDAASAYAVYVPFTDVFGNPNAQQGKPGHEVAFLTRDSQNNDISWAYVYNATKQTLQRYDFDDAGTVGVRNVVSGTIDTSATYSPITGVTDFSARTFEATELTGSANPYASLVSNALAQANLPAYAEPVGILRNGAQNPPDLYGGNTIIQLELQTAHGIRVLHLATMAMPSGFTVHQRATFRVYVYAEKHTTPSGLFKNFPISWQNIYAQLVYSVDPNAKPSQWKRWCDLNLYELRTNDAHKSLFLNYVPNQYSETVDAIFAEVANGTLPNPSDPKCSTAPGNL